MMFASFRREINPCQPWFDVYEYTTILETEHDVEPGNSDKDVGDDPPSYPLHVADTFGATGCLVLPLKVSLMVFVTGSLAWILWEEDHVEYYFIYGESWVMAINVLYMLLSVINALWALPQPNTAAASQEKPWEQMNNNSTLSSTRVSWTAKLTWITATLALTCGASVSILFWTAWFVFPGEFEESRGLDLDTVLDFQNILAPYGCLWLAVLIDAFYLNRIPLRWTHIWLVWACSLLYFGWTVLHSPLVLDIGTPSQIESDSSEADNSTHQSDEGATYPPLVWSSDIDDIIQSVVITVAFTFVLQTIVFGFLRTWSRGSWYQWCCCQCCQCQIRQDRLRYCPDMEDDEEETRVVVNVLEKTESFSVDRYQQEPYYHDDHQRPPPSAPYADGMCAC